MACEAEIKISLKKWLNQLPTSNEKAEVMVRVALGERILVEGEKLHVEEDGTHTGGGGGGGGGGSGGGGGEHGGRGKVGRKGSSIVKVGRKWEVKQVVCLPYGKNYTDVLNDLTMYPLLISFIEVQPKDKRHKEEKTHIMCQGTLELLPYILGHTSSTHSSSSSTFCIPEIHMMNLYPCHVADGGGAHFISVTDNRKSVLELEISFTGEFMLASSNVLSLRLRSLHSLPDSWIPNAFPFTFTASFPVPSSPTTKLTFTQGLLQFPPSKDSTSMPTHWRWPGSILAPEAAQAAKMESQPLEEEIGFYHDRSEVEWREEVEADKPRVGWNCLQRTWLSAETNGSFMTQLSQCGLWPLEVGRFTVPPAAAAMGTSRVGKKTIDIEPTLSYHAVAYIDLSPLLYPGASKICGAFPLYAYSEADVLTKTSNAQPSSLLPPTDTDDVLCKKQTPMKLTSSGTKIQADVGMAGSVDGGTSPGEGVKREACAFEEAQTYVYLEVQLLNPLIPKRPSSVLASRVKTYIPSRSSFPSLDGGVEHVVLEFQQHMATLASQLVGQYRDLCVSGEQLGDEQGKRPGEEAMGDADERRHKFLFHLNSTGKYHTIKEELKRSVVKIVREKYMSQLPGAKDKLEMQRFLSQLYIFLVDQMHVGLKKTFSIVDSPPVAPSVLNSDLIKLFAFEAESSGDYELAEHYHKQRVSMTEKSNCEVWYDYAVFCLLLSLYDRAKQCLSEAVSMDISNIPALMLLGMVCCLDEKFTESEDLFEMATTSDPRNVVAWTMRGLHYELTGNRLMQDMCFLEAKKCLENPDHKTFLKMPQPPPTPLPYSTKTHPPSLLSKQVATNSKSSITSSKLLGQHSARSLMKATAKDVSVEGGSEALMNVSSTACNEQGVASTLGAGEIASDSQASGVSLPGVSHSGQDQRGLLTDRSRDHIKSDLNVNIEQFHTAEGEITGEESNAMAWNGNISIFLLTANHLLDVHALKFSEMCLAHELASLRAGPASSHAYLMAEARLHMHRRKYKEAATCVKQALVVDILDSNAWALLGHAHFMAREESEAADVYQRTLDYEQLPSHVHLVYSRLASIYLMQDKYALAREMYLRACRHTTSSLTWLGVGVACYRLGEHEEAEEALCEANILNNHNAEVWAYLAMVCLKTGRPVEAEQALKFAIKAGLSNENLFSELRELHQSHTPHIDLVHLPSPLAPRFSQPSPASQHNTRTHS